MAAFASSAAVVLAFRASGYGSHCSPLPHRPQLSAVNLSSRWAKSAKVTATTRFRSTKSPNRPISRLQGARHFRSPRSPNSLVSRLQVRVAAMERSTSAVKGDEKAVAKLQKDITEYFDEAAGMIEESRGVYMHHGFYEPGSTVSGYTVSSADHQAAQIRMIEELLRFASVSDDPMNKPKRILDIGCGFGGASQYLAKKYGAECKGITLSPVEAQRAQVLAVAEGLQSKVSFEVADALALPFPDAQFDLVWSMESAEHMPDKEKFVHELARVTAPGAKIIIASWCPRNLSPSEQSLKPEEEKLLNKICSAYYYGQCCSRADYVKILESLSFEDIKTANWTKNVVPYWEEYLRLALTWKGLTTLVKNGWKSLKAALSLRLLIEGFEKELLQFSIITCQKPKY